MSMICTWGVGPSLRFENMAQSLSWIFGLTWASEGALVFYSWSEITIWDPKVCDPSNHCYCYRFFSQIQLPRCQLLKQLSSLVESGMLSPCRKAGFSLS